MAYRRDRTVRDAYEERFLSDRPGPYSRAGGDRRGHFSRPEEDYNRGGYEYEGGPRFFPNGGGPRNYHGDDQRGYPGDGAHFPSERRGAPPSRREDFPYRGPREEPHTGGRPMEYSNRAPPPPPPPNARNQGVYPAPRSLPESGADTLVQAILNLERGEDRDHFRRKAPPFPPPRERSPARRDSARSPHSRSGSSVSSRGFSPDRAKSLLFPSQQGKQKIPGLSREGSPHSTTSNKEENHPPEGEKEEPSVAPITEESPKASTDKFQQRRSLAIAAKVQEIEKPWTLLLPPTGRHRPSDAYTVEGRKKNLSPAPLPHRETWLPSKTLAITTASNFQVRQYNVTTTLVTQYADKGFSRIILVNVSNNI
ncbi:periphilin-1 isoform X3 [Nerophis ophidion]|uniref:periphilin-1 isoform X3 n=1 Tax=Nerophis ophidion TaxID=159077 RepID=UPI002AE0605C|nr:periphilin-1 isoform X3 [Nerophis ophidion]